MRVRFAAVRASVARPCERAGKAPRPGLDFQGRSGSGRPFFFPPLRPFAFYRENLVLTSCFYSFPRTRFPCADRPEHHFRPLPTTSAGATLGRFFQNHAGRRADPLPSLDRYEPELDRLADAGLQLRSHTCPAPVCVSSRSFALLPASIRATRRFATTSSTRRSRNQPTLATVLRKQATPTSPDRQMGPPPGERQLARPLGRLPDKPGFEASFYRLRAPHADAHSHSIPTTVSFANVDKSSADNRKEVYNANGFACSANWKTVHHRPLCSQSQEGTSPTHVDFNSTPPSFLTLALGSRPNAGLHGADPGLTGGRRA